MTIRDYVAIVRQRLRLFVAVVLATVVVALGVFLVVPASYTAEISFYVSMRQDGSAVQSYQAATLTQQRVASYAQLVTDPRVTIDVANQLDPPISVERLLRKITATTRDNSLLIQVSATDPDPVRAARIANDIGTVLPRVVDDLERPALPTDRPSFGVRVVQPAPVPALPSSLGLAALLGIGLAGGLVISFVAVVVRSALDTTIRSEQALSKVSGLPVLATVPLPSDPSNWGVEAAASTAEPFRRLRANLQFSLDSNRRLLSIASSHRREGRSTTAVGLASAFAASSYRVLLVDADLQNPRLAAMFGMDSAVGLATVLRSKAELSEAVQHHQPTGVTVLPAGPPTEDVGGILLSPTLADLVKTAGAGFDYVIFDGPSILESSDSVAVSSLVDGTIVVCRQGEARGTDLMQALETFDRSPSTSILGFVLTHDSPRRPSTSSVPRA